MKYKHIALFRFLFSIALAAICLVSCLLFGFSIGNSFEWSWITFGTSYLIQAVYIIFKTQSSSSIRLHAKDEDLGIWLQFVVVIVCCSVSLFSVLFWDNQEANIIVSNQVLFVISVSLSWFVVHMSFTFRYAHLYYGDLNNKYLSHIKGLEFPNEEHPDYLDFAYYAYTIGMTFQVSDVTAKSKGIRRLTLLHSIISFVFNTILVALTINEVLK